jgi:DNA-binding Lrp family transcriptional regulator
VIAQLPQVLSCHKITGDADYVLQVLAEDLDSYSDFIEQVLRRQQRSGLRPSSPAWRCVRSRPVAVLRYPDREGMSGPGEFFQWGDRVFLRRCRKTSRLPQPRF